MHDDDWLTARFEESRPAAAARTAYRMLGSHAEADDAVQETWLPTPPHRPEPEIENVGGLLTTVVGRVCLDRLRPRPGPTRGPVDDLPTGDDTDVTSVDPVDEALLAESVGTALMVVLDRLGPAERVAFVLHDVFAVPFDDVGDILGRSRRPLVPARQPGAAPAAGNTPTGGARPRRVERDVVRHLLAARGGDFDWLMQLLDPDVVLLPDAAAVGMGSLAETHGAASGRERALGGTQRNPRHRRRRRRVRVGARRGTAGVVQFTVRDDRIVAIDVTGDDGRIRHSTS